MQEQTRAFREKIVTLASELQEELANKDTMEADMQCKYPCSILCEMRTVMIWMEGPTGIYHK